MGSTELYDQRTSMSVDRKVNLICYTMEIDVCISLSLLDCIIKLILYSKIQYNQINITIGGHRYPSNLYVDRSYLDPIYD